MRFLWLLLVSLMASCALVNPVDLPPLQDPLLAEPPADIKVIHRIYAYGDSRTGVFLFENQENFGEGVHDWVVQQMLARGKPDIVLFMGDAVYSGGASFHYDNFVSVINRFKAANVPFFPAMGNHELLAGIIGVLSPWWSGDQTAKSADAGEQMVRDHLLAKHLHDPRLDLKPGQVPLPISKVDADAKHIHEHIMPRLEAKMTAKPVAERMERGVAVMNEIYVKRAGLDLAPMFNGTTYYAIGNDSTSLTVRVIVLDTNNLDYPPQLDWFKAQMANAADRGLIIVVGHHPPDTINGWDPYMPYLTDKKAVLWMFSHVHALEYAFLNGEKPNNLSRAEFITGGGGAPPDANDESSYPIAGWTSGPPGLLSGRFFHFLDIRITADSIYVTVVGCTRKGEPMVPKATYRINLPK
jgi:3',5'-cyclic AMP phosphodiesterase CpdA